MKYVELVYDIFQISTLNWFDCFYECSIINKKILLYRYTNFILYPLHIHIDYFFLFRIDFSREIVSGKYNTFIEQIFNISFNMSTKIKCKKAIAGVFYIVSALHIQDSVRK